MTKPGFKMAVLVVFVVSLMTYGILAVASSMTARTQKVQYSADGWDEDNKYTMVSVFLNSAKGVAKDDVRGIISKLDAELVNEAMEAEGENARLYLASYSRKTSVTASSEKASNVSLNAYVFSGDYFRFHPHELVSGCYVPVDDARTDLVVMDTEAAWKLFGAVDVDGMDFTCNGNVYTVAGIVEPESGYMTKDGGAETGTIYFCESSVSSLGDGGFTCCEYLFPNPVTGFAKRIIKKTMESRGVSENNMVIVENSTRYTLGVSAKRLLKWHTKGMSKHEVAYPYWENSARAVENIVDVMTFFQLLSLLIAGIIAVVSIVRFHPIHRFKLLVVGIVNKLRK